MIAKVYSRLGPIFIKIAEEEVSSVDEAVERWKYVYLEVYDGEELVFAEELY